MGPSRVSPRSQARPTEGEQDRTKRAAEAASGLCSLLGASSRCYWRAGKRQRRSASLDANVDNEDGEEDEVGNIDISTQMQYGDTDDGIWPGEFVVMTIVVTEPEAEPEMEMVGARLRRRRVERDIGAAFALVFRHRCLRK